jgi:hypothetical protein
MMPGGVAVELEIEILQCRYVHAISNRVHWLFVAAGLVRSNWPLIVMNNDRGTTGSTPALKSSCNH